MRGKSQWSIHPGVLFNPLMPVVMKEDPFLRPQLVKNSVIMIYFFET